MTRNPRMAVAAMAMAMTMVAGMAAAESSAPAGALEGTWRVQVSTVNCATGDPLVGFRAALTFAPGGTLTGTTTAPMFQPGQRTPDHGVWERRGAGEYHAVSEAFILFSTSTPPFPVQRGVQRIEQSITMEERNRFESRAAVEFQDVDGNVLARLCADAVGTRFE